ncbi:hypothetical protein P8452_14423 [Trifolium repens]|nr:hypothetical protein P8452_14423 [Trifolium repens]
MVKETGEKIIPRVDVWVSARVNKAGEIDNKNVKSVKDKCYFYRHRYPTYSKEKLDEVKEEWATYMVEDVVDH